MSEPAEVDVDSEAGSQNRNSSPLSRKGSMSTKNLVTIAKSNAAADLDDPDLDVNDIGTVKSKATEKVNELIEGLAAGSFGAASVRVPTHI